MSEIVDFSKIKEILKTKKPVAAKPQEGQEQKMQPDMQVGVDAFLESLKTAKGFVGISFDKDGTPSVYDGGELNLLEVIGTLIMIQTEYTDYVRNNYEMVEEE